MSDWASEFELPDADPRPVRLRIATLADVPGLLGLLADDMLGATREDRSADALERYRAAFLRIADDPRNELWVATRSNSMSGDGAGADPILGTYQVTYIPYLSRGGNERALIEAVRVASAERGQGLGAWMMRHALHAARDRGCLLVQLTTDKRRDAAHRFYVRLGFTASHEGMKLDLTRWAGTRRGG